jgi:PII-like signaling protein
MVTVIDREEQIAKLIPHLDAMVGEGLIVQGKVDVTRYTPAEAEARGTES